MAEAVGNGQRHHVGLRWIVAGIVDNAVMQRGVDGRQRAVARGRDHATAGTVGCRADRERIVRCGSVAVGDMQARHRLRPVAILGDAQRVGADHRPGGEARRCVRRTIGADKGDGQRLASGMAMTVTDLCDVFDLQYVACMQEVEIGIGRMIGPVQDNRSAVAWRAVECHVAGSNQRRYVDVTRHRRRSIVLDRGIAGYECRQRVADVSIMDAERTHDRAEAWAPQCIRRKCCRSRMRSRCC